MKEDVLPEGWEKTKLGKYLYLKNGYAFKKTDYVEKSKHSYPIIRISDINNFTATDKNAIHTNYIAKGFELEKNDLLIAMSGATTGKLGVYKGNIPAYQNQRVGNLKLIGKGDSQFRNYLMLSLQELIEKLAYGGAQPNISGKIIEDIDINLPPLPEQQYLSKKLTALLDEVAQTKQRLEAIPALLKQFRQSVLADAVSGRLTEEWRENNELSLSDWIQSNVGNIAKVETGKTPSRKNQEYWENGYIPWLTSSCTGLPYVNFADEFVTDLAVKECGLKIFNKNTLLLAMYGEGKTRGQVTELKLSATCNQACAAITANNNLINNQYLKLSLLKNYDEIRKSASGGNQPNLNLTKVREIKIHLPSLKEQTQIVQKVETYFALADGIETQVNAALENVNLLTQSILAKAFNGELSAAWRNSQVRETQGKV
jgi:restriction modification system DNA specificity domain protein